MPSFLRFDSVCASLSCGTVITGFAAVQMWTHSYGQWEHSKSGFANVVLTVPARQMRMLAAQDPFDVQGCCCAGALLRGGETCSVKQHTLHCQPNVSRAA